MARYIDANELQCKLEQVAKEPDYMHDGDTWDTGVRLAGLCVDKMPTADVEVVRHGYWKHNQSPLGWQDVDVAVCSECGEEWVLEDWDIEEFSEWHKFCSICGAKMDGGKAE